MGANIRPSLFLLWNTQACGELADHERDVADDGGRMIAVSTP
jgi:hypothetical protein